MDYSLPGSSVHGILQVRILEWVAISFPGDSSWPRDQTWVFRIAGRLFTNGKCYYKICELISFSSNRSVNVSKQTEMEPQKNILGSQICA